MRFPLRRIVKGKPLDLRDKNVFQHVSLIAFFAWVGLGADGLSSSAYGPEEAFRHLHGHTYLAVFLAVAMVITIWIISASYSRIIEEFPSGGGGYMIASKLLGDRAGVVAGCALLVDYVLTIAISIASCGNALFAFMPDVVLPYKMHAEVFLVGLLVVLNLRGVKESVAVLTPIFIGFLVTHVVLIGGALILGLGDVSGVVTGVRSNLASDAATLGVWAIILIFARAFALGGGTFTGIEAVSTGLPIMREPRVQTAKRTMVLMAVSLAITASGILLAYLLLDIQPSDREPMNATLAKAFASAFPVGGQAFVIITLLAEGALLFVAAQAGFIAGPQVMAYMARDSWFPHQFAALSERLTMHNGVYLMGGAALATLFYTGGNVHALVVMYSINVFLDFSMANLGMTRLWLTRRATDPQWSRRILVHLVALSLCASVLIVTILEKFTHGGWVTLVVTGSAIVLCYLVRRHYKMVATRIGKLNQELATRIGDVPDTAPADLPEMDPEKPTAVLLAGGYGGLGLHALLEIERVFPAQFRQVMFISAGVIDSGSFKGPSEIEALRASVQRDLARYVRFAKNRLKMPADSDMVIGTEAVAELERLCREVHLRFPRSVFFAGQLIFREPSWHDRLLHNLTAFAIQRRLQFDGLPMVVLPVRVLK